MNGWMRSPNMATRGRRTPCWHSGILCEVHEILDQGKDYLEDTRPSESIGIIGQVRARPTVTSDGKRGAISVVRDVTQEKRSEERYRTLFEGSKDAIIIST